jgi:hypothetical protein
MQSKRLSKETGLLRAIPAEETVDEDRNRLLFQESVTIRHRNAGWMYKIARIQVKTTSGWQDIREVGDLEAGQVFRMFDPSGESVIRSLEGYEEFTSQSDPHVYAYDANRNPIWEIKVETKNQGDD